MSESVAVALVALAGIIGIVAIGYVFIRIMINTTREANRKRDNEK